MWGAWLVAHMGWVGWWLGLQSLVFAPGSSEFFTSRLYRFVLHPCYKYQELWEIQFRSQALFRGEREDQCQDCQDSSFTLANNTKSCEKYNFVHKRSSGVREKTNVHTIQSTDYWGPRHISISMAAWSSITPSWQTSLQTIFNIQGTCNTDRVNSSFSSAWHRNLPESATWSLLDVGGGPGGWVLGGGAGWRVLGCWSALFWVWLAMCFCMLSPLCI